MLGKFKYKVTFNSTGKTLQGDIDFKPGLSGISGANEQGKSTVLELIRFALFGTAALRAPLTSYKSISTKLEFEVKGEVYEVERNKSNAVLRNSAGPVATSTSAVNEKIEKIFGYGLNVFDIAHYTGQGQVEALTAMKPLDRKKMIDRVIGLESLDVAAASVAAEAVNLRAEIKGMQQSLGMPPQPPVRPAHTTEEVRAKLAALAPELEELRDARSWLRSNPTTEEPAKPVDPNLPLASELRRLEEERDVIVRRHADLSRQTQGVMQTTWTSEGLARVEAEGRAYDAWLADQEFARQHGPYQAEDTEDSLRAILDQWARWDKWANAYDEVNRLTRHKLQCPECGHAWATDPGALAAAEAEMAKWEGVERPKIAESIVKNRLMTALAWAKRSAPIEHEPVKPCFTAWQITAQRKAIALKPQMDELANLIIPASRAEALRERESYDRAMSDHGFRHAEWVEKNRKRGLKTLVVLALEDIEKEHAEWTAILPQCLEYDALHRAYVESKERYETSALSLAAKQEELEQLVNSTEAVKTLRAKIKQYLTPSLNVAASNLISRMTGGARQDIAIDENFETILVDGQPVETLSGSGKAVANLAIRLGLGQVLTNKVFSVFLGDEIDASMDDDRANSTAECLEGLNSVIGQIILVSHKDLAVQHQIRIG